MDLQFGYDISYQFPAPTAVVLLLHLRPELTPRLIAPETFKIFPEVPFADFIDTYGNRCIRFTAPAGTVEISSRGMIHDNGLPPPTLRHAGEYLVSSLPADVLPYLLPSRFCDLELLGTTAWSLFGSHAPGWSRVQAICDWVHGHLSYDENQAGAPKTASQSFQDRLGVSRDYTHLAITLCRCLNIPARYATGYLADLGPGGDPIPMDFATWMEVYLGGSWHLFDVRHNARRPGHLAIARGRDAADVASMTSFGPHALTHFEVLAREAEAVAFPVAS
jgi:transglutaminase-like putative cysteine protease